MKIIILKSEYYFVHYYAAIFVHACNNNWHESAFLLLIRSNVHKEIIFQRDILKTPNLPESAFADSLKRFSFGVKSMKISELKTVGVERFSQQHTVRHIFYLAEVNSKRLRIHRYFCVFAGHIFKADGVSYGFAKLAAQLLADTLRNWHRSDTARLNMSKLNWFMLEIILYNDSWQQNMYHFRIKPVYSQ